MPAFLMLKMGNGHEKQADSEGGKTKMNRIEDVTDYITECDKEVGEALEELEGGAVHVVPRKKKYIWDLIPCVSNALRMKWQMRNRSGLHRVTLPGILFINIRCQSRLEGNNR